MRYLWHCPKLLYLMLAVFSVFLAYLMVCKRFERCQIPYQKGEETIEATFGDSLPTLVDQIRKVR